MSLVEDRAMPCASTPTVVPMQGTMARDVQKLVTLLWQGRSRGELAWSSPTN